MLTVVVGLVVLVARSVFCTVAGLEAPRAFACCGLRLFGGHVREDDHRPYGEQRDRVRGGRIPVRSDGVTPSTNANPASATVRVVAERGELIWPDLSRTAASARPRAAQVA
jgi:hypothetical protein